jgi:hypothetical protein
MKRQMSRKLLLTTKKSTICWLRCRSTVCSVVEVQVPMVCGAFAVDGSKHNGGSDQTERRVHEERDPDAFLET